VPLAAVAPGGGMVVAWSDGAAVRNVVGSIRARSLRNPVRTVVSPPTREGAVQSPSFLTAVAMAPGRPVGCRNTFRRI
jgi:hypothetical protein